MQTWHLMMQPQGKRDGNMIDLQELDNYMRSSTISAQAR
jgi:hypothetical protein